MGASYLERELLSACPSFRTAWERLARDCRDEPSNALALLPHLGTRTRRAWDAAMT